MFGGPGNSASLDAKSKKRKASPAEPSARKVTRAAQPAAQSTAKPNPKTRAGVKNNRMPESETRYPTPPLSTPLEEVGSSSESHSSEDEDERLERLYGGSIGEDGFEMESMLPSGILLDPSYFPFALGGMLGPSVPAKIKKAIEGLKSKQIRTVMRCLAELNDFVMMSGDEIAFRLKMDSVVPAIMDLLGQREPRTKLDDPEKRGMLCAQILSVLLESSQIARSIVSSSAEYLEIIRSHISTRRSLSVADQCIVLTSRLSKERPFQLLKAGFLNALVQAIESFCLSTQRQCAQIALNLVTCDCKGESISDLIAPAMARLGLLLNHPDTTVASTICSCWSRAVTIHPSSVAIDPALTAIIKNPRNTLILSGLAQLGKRDEKMRRELVSSRDFFEKVIIPTLTDGGLELVCDLLPSIRITTNGLAVSESSIDYSEMCALVNIELVQKTEKIKSKEYLLFFLLTQRLMGLHLGPELESLILPSVTRMISASADPDIVLAAAAFIGRLETVAPEKLVREGVVNSLQLLSSSSSACAGSYAHVIAQEAMKTLTGLDPSGGLSIETDIAELLRGGISVFDFERSGLVEKIESLLHSGEIPHNMEWTRLADLLQTSLENKVVDSNESVPSLGPELMENRVAVTVTNSEKKPLMSIGVDGLLPVSHLKTIIDEDLMSDEPPVYHWDDYDIGHIFNLNPDERYYDPVEMQRLEFDQDVDYSAYYGADASSAYREVGDRDHKPWLVDQTKYRLFVNGQELVDSSIMMEAIGKSFKKEETLLGRERMLESLAISEEIRLGRKTNRNPQIESLIKHLWSAPHEITYTDDPSLLNKKMDSRTDFSLDKSAMVFGNESRDDLHAFLQSWSSYKFPSDLDSDWLRKLKLFAIIGIINGERTSEEISALVSTFYSSPVLVATRLFPSWTRVIVDLVPWMLTLGAKRQVLTAVYLEVYRGISANLSAELKNLIPIPRRKIQINRRLLPFTAFTVFDKFACSPRKDGRIIPMLPVLELGFFGEEGTGSGPTVEYFTSVIEELRKSKLFRTCSRDQSLLPAVEYIQEGHWTQLARSVKNGYVNLRKENILEKWRMLGILVGRSILDSRWIDLNMSPVFWTLVKRVACQEPLMITRDLIEVIEPELFRSLQAMKTMTAEELESLDISAHRLPGHEWYPFSRGSGKVTHANLEEYIENVTRAHLIDGLLPQVVEFANGFAQVVPIEILKLVSPEQMSELISGSCLNRPEFWTREAVSKAVKTDHGYTSQSPQFKDFVEVVTELSESERMQFVKFITGAQTLPPEGLAGLRPPLTIVKAVNGSSDPDSFLPSVMTCANFVKLPEYSSKEKMKQQLTIAITEGQGSFLLS